MSAQSLKPKHIEALVKNWQEKELSAGAMKNRMAVIRWWAQKVNRQNVVARSNDHYGIPNRQFVTNESKARSVGAEELGKIRDARVRMSLELQQAFGLRREEAIKFIPDYADRGDHIVLKESWTKGGKARTIPIRTEAQRAVLDRARQLAGNGSLIPSAKQLPTAIAIVRSRDRQGRVIQDAWSSSCLCPEPLRGTDRLAVTRGGRSSSQNAHAGTKSRWISRRA